MIRRGDVKKSIGTSSWIAAVFCWLLLSALMVFILWGARDRARLIRDNDNERLFTTLFASLRDYEDFGAAIESNPALRDRIIGFAIYGDDLGPLYSWGKAPPVFDEETLGPGRAGRNGGRFIIPNKGGRTVRFVLRSERMPPPPEPNLQNGPRPEPGMPPLPEMPPRTRRRNAAGTGFVFFDTRVSGKYVYIDIFHPAYWSTMTVTTALFPLGGLALLFLVFYIRGLYLRNAEYRERIEAQQNLVVLGTAASTLAHEIKNPLLSIRLQTGILGKLLPDKGKEEIGIINQEVDRLSALIYRVNDYLREARGVPAPVNSYDLLSETSRRLCGGNIVTPESCRDGFFLMDGDRARSVFENLIRNALESGGPREAVGASISRSRPGANGRSSIVITIFDRGKGIPAGDLKRVFDPFFTSKSTGTGIGLSISKRFVEAAQGAIVSENREGGGALIRLTLPEAPGGKL
jgi:two-component system sensor histidine kinase HydH